MRVKEVGESEGLAVMAEILVEMEIYITGRESEPTSDWSFVTKR